MGRILRAYSESGVYHILFRGVNQQNIFEEKADYDKLKDALLVIKEEMEFETCQKCTSPNGFWRSRKDFTQNSGLSQAVGNRGFMVLIIQLEMVFPEFNNSLITQFA